MLYFHIMKLSRSFLVCTHPLKSSPSQSHHRHPPHLSLIHCPTIPHHPTCHILLLFHSLPTRGTTRKTSHPKERPQDTAQTPRQAEQAAEVERGSRVRGEGDTDLQAALGVPLSLSMRAHSMKLDMVQKEAVPTEFLGVGLLGFGLILFQDLVSHWEMFSCGKFFFYLREGSRGLRWLDIWVYVGGRL